MASVLIGAFERLWWAVHQWDSGRASSHHGPGLRSQAPKCSPLRHPGSSVKGKLLVLLCRLHVYILCLPKMSAEFLCCECMFERGQTKQIGKCLSSVSFQCLVLLLCFRRGCCLLSHIFMCEFVHTFWQAFPSFSFFFKWASRNKCVIQRGCQLFTFNNVRGLKGCRGALGLKQTYDIWSKSQKSILLLLGKSNQDKSLVKICQVLNQVTSHRLNHTNN